MKQSVRYLWKKGLALRSKPIPCDARRQPMLVLAITLLSVVRESCSGQWDAYSTDTRIPGATKRHMAAMFCRGEIGPAASPLELFRYYQYGRRTVHLDGCVEVEAAYYGAPPGSGSGCQLNVPWDDLWVSLLDSKTGQLLREHLRPKRCRHGITLSN
jgi:hypothetical protein